MNLRSGIPTVADVEQLVQTPLYRSYTDYNAAFLTRHRAALAKYGRHWGQDPFRLWSRRWEYPFVGEHVLAFLRQQGDRPIKILDAGSGVTFLDYSICENIPGASVVCADYNQSYHSIFADVNANTPHARVSFQEANLQKLPFADGTFDSVVCLSVLEHTDQYGLIVKEFARTLSRGGQLALTFDLSLDGKFALSQTQVSELLAHVAEYFEVQSIDPQPELTKMTAPAGLLTTDHVRRTQPELLPWKFPLLKGVHDLIKGQGWTGGFRSKAVFCLDARRK